MMKGNVGEWSEFYAFLKILSDKKISAADSNLNPIAGRYFDVLKVSREEKSGDVKVYDIKDEADIRISKEGVFLKAVPYLKLKKSITAILSAMHNPVARTFQVAEADDIAQYLSCSRLKAGSARKSDLVLVIHDRIAEVEIQQGFSIKSRIGSPATLLNAGKGTNFVYSVIPKKEKRIDSLKRRKSVRDNVRSLGEDPKSLIFKNVVSEQFTANLRKIDTFLPEILAALTKNFYFNNGKTIKELVETTDFAGVVSVPGFVLTKDVCKYKIKQFLAAVALGMTPEKEWDGLSSAQGGYIVVREDGELVCYHLYNRDQFEEYLYVNTKLETASTTRHQFGEIYEEGGGSLINLNLQIRFIK